MSIHRCFIHLRDGKGPLTQFSRVSFEKSRHCHELWVNLDGDQRLIAEKYSGIFKDAVAQKSSAVSDYFYHKSCYSRFTNVANIKCSQARCAKIMANWTENTDAAFIKEQDACMHIPAGTKCRLENADQKMQTRNCWPDNTNQILQTR